MATTKSVEANDNKELAMAQARIAELEMALSQARIVKEKSDYFCNNDGEQMTWKNLSETKRYFECNHSEVLKKMCETLKVQYLTSKQFHSSLSGLI